MTTKSNDCKHLVIAADTILSSSETEATLFLREDSFFFLEGVLVEEEDDEIANCVLPGEGLPLVEICVVCEETDLSMFRLISTD